MKKLFLMIFLVSISHYCFSQETNTKSALMLQKVLKQLGLKRTDIHEPLITEKVLPNIKSNMVMVIPKYRKSETDEYSNHYYEFDAYVVIVNSQTGKILAQYIEENAWTSDAVAITGIIVDTGLFQLNSDTRAFGVRVSYANSSQPNPFNQTDLYLFIHKNNKLQKVLDKFITNQFGGEWDTRCAGEFDDMNSVIDIAKTGNRGMNNLVVKSTSVHTKNVAVKEDCLEKKTTTHQTKVLKFNGLEYK